jgi:hypothetical protein
MLKINRQPSKSKYLFGFGHKKAQKAQKMFFVIFVPLCGLLSFAFFVATVVLVPARLDHARPDHRRRP